METVIIGFHLSIKLYCHINIQLPNVMQKNRDSYIDFLRALGLLLLIGVHVTAPDWYKPLRSFDVPLMVFVSAICYRPIRNGGYLEYCIKRFKRIYIPVAVFLTIFFIGIYGMFLTTGHSLFSGDQIIGSYLLLNRPSIGYVWIMRVFLMMALLIPFLHRVIDKCNIWVALLIVYGSFIVQEFLVLWVTQMTDSIGKSILDELLLYCVGFTGITIMGLKIRQFTSKSLLAANIIGAVCILVFLGWNDWTFNPQEYKYPPQSLYLLYGLFGCTFLWQTNNIISPYVDYKIFGYLSTNSMWIYLWHIIPVQVLARLNCPANTWLLRYLIVMGCSIIFFTCYRKIISFLPDRIRVILQ